MIKEVPSEVFNAGLDKWIKLSMGMDLQNICKCSYCREYRKGHACPLTKECREATDLCCNGLFKKFKIEYGWGGFTKKAMKIADQIVDLIIDRCVYDEE